MTTTSRKINRLCKNFIAAVALPALVAMFGTASAVAGALFTTDNFCNKVNGNIYAAKEDVFLNGGPDGTGSQLEPSTTYCIRVSAPGCAENLNTIRDATVTTDGDGFFPCINLFLVTGFDDTCNLGGEYKVEACPVETEGCVFRHGNQCKSDNFKVGATPTCAGGAPVCIFCPDDVDVPCTERTFGQCATVTYRPPFVIGGTATCDPASGSCFNVGDTLVTCTVDGSDPAVSCSFTVTVANCPQECTLPALDPVGACSCSGPKAVTYSAPATLTDGNGVVFTLGSCTPASGSPFIVGTTPVLCTYTDSVGDECDNTFSVTVTEDAGPSISHPKDIELQCGDSTDPSNTGVASYTGDACGGKVTITHTDVSTAANCTGKAGIDRTWTATDICLKRDSCVQHITFVDKTAPVLSGPTTPIAATTSCSGLPKVTYTVTAKDNCGGTPTPSCIPTSGSAFVVGTTHVSCQAVDNCGNPGYFGFDVSVTEGTDSACGAFTIGFWQNKNGQAKITGANQTALRAYLASFKPFCDLGSQTIATYVYNIVKAANASGTTMNAMLKAQMLATALNVYFSPALGNLDIDITQICKCIDSTTGTATCSGRYNTSAGFAGLPTTCQSVNALLAYAASQFLNTAPYSCASPSWYGSNKTIQQSSKDTFDSINNGFALICGP